MANASTIVEPLSAESAGTPRVELLGAVLCHRDATLIFAEIAKCLFASPGRSGHVRSTGDVACRAALALLNAELSLAAPGFRSRIVAAGASELLGPVRRSSRPNEIVIVVGLGATRALVVDEGCAVRVHELGHGAVIALHAPDMYDWHPVPRRPSPSAIALTLWGSVE